MKSSTKKVLALGCGLPVAFIILSMLLLSRETHKKREYIETSYKKDYLWNDIEAGTVLRFPKNVSIPIGRYYAVIAFKNGQMADARILFQGPSGEVPEHPEFVSGKEQTIIYRIKSKGGITLDLSRWTTYPTRDSIPSDSNHP